MDQGPQDGAGICMGAKQLKFDFQYEDEKPKPKGKGFLEALRNAAEGIKDLPPKRSGTNGDEQASEEEIDKWLE